MADRAEYTVAAELSYCYHTRYPAGIAAKEAQDLCCPNCGEDKIAVVEETGLYAEMMLGDLAECWMCKYQFRITENCWKWRMTGK